MSLKESRLVRVVVENGDLLGWQTVPGFGKAPSNQYAETVLKIQVEVTASDECCTFQSKLADEVLRKIVESAESREDWIHTP